MKYQIMMGILFTLLAKRKMSATELAGKYGISARSVYRYVDEMTCAGIPIDVQRGAQGGIYISDAFKLPLFTREEYEHATSAILAVNEQLGDSALQSALGKLKLQYKAERRDAIVAGNFLVDGGTWGDEKKFSDKLTFLERAISEKKVLEIDYVDREGERSHRSILPHLLVLKQNIWYVYSFCNMRKEFRLFKVGRIRAFWETGETFAPLPFRREDLPLHFWNDKETCAALFEIAPQSLAVAEEWLGIENVYERDGKYYADVVLPDDDALVGKILSMGEGFRVLSPALLLERVKREAANIAKLYG